MIEQLSGVWDRLVKQLAPALDPTCTLNAQQREQQQQQQQPSEPCQRAEHDQGQLTQQQREELLGQPQQLQEQQQTPPGVDATGRPAGRLLSYDMLLVHHLLDSMSLVMEMADDLLSLCLSITCMWPAPGEFTVGRKLEQSQLHSESSNLRLCPR